MTIDDMLKPGSHLPVNSDTVGALVAEVTRLRAISPMMDEIVELTRSRDEWRSLAQAAMIMLGRPSSD